MGAGLSRLGRLARHLVEQHTFYPLYPPLAPVDFQYHEQFSMGFRPHLLLIPSRLQFFAEVGSRLGGFRDLVWMFPCGGRFLSLGWHFDHSTSDFLSPALILMDAS